MKVLRAAYNLARNAEEDARDAYCAAIRAELPPGRWDVSPDQAWSEGCALAFDGILWHATDYDGNRKIRGHAPTINAALLALDACRAKKGAETG